MSRRGTPASKPSALIKEFLAHPSAVTATCLAPAPHTFFATGSTDCTVRVWSLEQSPSAPLVTTLAAPSEISCVTFVGPDATILASGTRDGSLLLATLSDPAQALAAAAAAPYGSPPPSVPSRVFPAHKDGVLCLDSHPFGALLVTGGADCKVCIWDASSGELLQTYRGHAAPVTTVRHSPDGRWVLSGDASGRVKVWDITEGKQINEFDALSAICSASTSAAAAISAAAAAAGGGVGSPASPSSPTAPGTGATAVTRLDFHPVEFLLCVCVGDRVLSFWDVEAFSLVSSSAPLPAPALATTFSAGGGCFLTAHGDGVRGWAWEPAAVPVAETAGGAGAGAGAVCVSSEGADGAVVTVSAYGRAVSVVRSDVRAFPLTAEYDAEEEGDTVGAPLGANGNDDDDDEPFDTPLPLPPSHHHGHGRLTHAEHDLTKATRDLSLAPTTRAPVPAPAGDRVPVSRRRAPQPAPQPAPAFESVAPAPAPVQEPAPEPAAPQQQQQQQQSGATIAAAVHEAISVDHTAMIAITSQRLLHLRTLREHWSRGDAKGAIDALVGMKDTAVACDFLTAVEQALTQSPSQMRLDLDTAAALVPVLVGLLGSRFEAHAGVGLRYVECITSSFASLVAETAAASLSQGRSVDFALRERNARCVKLQIALGDTRAPLAALGKRHKGLGARARAAVAAVDSFAAAGAK